MWWAEVTGKTTINFDYVELRNQTTHSSKLCANKMVLQVDFRRRNSSETVLPLICGG